MNNISGLLFLQAEAAPHKAALIQSGRAVDYAQLAANVRRRARFYQDKGLRDGDRVLVFVPMSVALYEILLALFYLGCTAVFLDSWADRERMDGALRAAECRGFIGIPKAFLLLLRSRELRRVPVKLFAASTGTAGDIAAPGTEETALITFTTGSTGQPKAAKRTHGFLLEQHRVLTKEMALPSDSIDLATLPIFALNNLACGITTVIPSFDMRRPGDVDGAKILAEAERCCATTVTASPAFLECLMRAMTPGRVPALRSVFTGGAAIDPAFARRLLDAFPGRKITAIYGSTEAEPIATLPMPELAECTDIRRGLPAGRPVDEITLAILPLNVEIQPSYTPEEWDALRVRDDAVGEICVAGPHVLKEYYHNPQAERENKIRVGETTVYHRTGDAGRMDDSGMLYLCGRASTLFRDASGALVCPMILESILKEIPGIRAGTVLRTESGVAACLETDLPEAEVEKPLKEKGIPFDRIVRLPHIPRDPRHNSKLDYGALRRLI